MPAVSIRSHARTVVYTNAGPSVRALRLRKGWRQGAFGERAGVSRQVVSRLERGELGGLTLRNVDRVVAALGATVSLQVRWRGEELDRLVDRVHAALQRDVADHLTLLRWDVSVEVSFNHFGDRGRVDVLARRADRSVVLVIEVKSALGDLQETLGRLDIKARLGRRIATDAGWPSVRNVVPALVIGDSVRARRIVVDHAALFERYEVRGRAAHAWLRHPSGSPPRGLLWFAKPTDSRQVVIRRGRRAPNASGAQVT